MSKLAARLGRLRAQAGQPAPAAEQGSALRIALSRRPGVRRPLSESERAGALEALAQRLGGECAGEGLTVVRKTVPFGEVPGPSSRGDDLRAALAAFGFPCGQPLFLDTETTGLSGGTGTVVFLVGLARPMGDHLEIMQCLLTRYQGESAMLERAASFAEDCDLLVTFNGKSFDLPLLGNRFRLAGRADPFVERPHLDLLHTTQRAFRNGWPDCTLKSAEQRLLDFYRHDDLPGALAPEAWFDWLREGRADRLPGVVEHNALDVLSLAGLCVALQRSYAEPVDCGADVRAIARFHRRQDGDDAAYRYLLRHRRHLDAAAAFELATLARRRHEWSLAVAAWSDLAADDHAGALEALAKYYEHVERDLARALQATERLLEIEDHAERHQHRRSRLLRKSAAGTVDP